MILFMIVTFLARLCRVRRDQNRHGGGIMFLTKHSLQAVERHDLEEDCELMWVEIPTKVNPTLFGLFYCPPNKSCYDLECLHDSLSHANLCNRSVFLYGDFNVQTLSGVQFLPV